MKDILDVFSYRIEHRHNQRCKKFIEKIVSWGDCEISMGETCTDMTVVRMGDRKVIIGTIYSDGEILAALGNENYWFYMDHQIESYLRGKE